MMSRRSYYTARPRRPLGPSHETGYFGGVGFKINMPMIGPGDYFTAQFNYTVGASGYAIDGATTAAWRHRLRRCGWLLLRL